MSAHLDHARDGTPARGPDRAIAPAAPVRGTAPAVSRLLAASRYLVLLAVAGCFLAAAVLFAYGLLAVVRSAVATLAADVASLGQAEQDVVTIAEHLAVDLIQLADVFLLGTVIYLIGLGLHLLFVNPWLPAEPWVAVGDLDDLKEMLVRVIILLVGVTFLGAFVELADDAPLPELSVATALVVAAFALLIFVSKLPNWSRPVHEREAWPDREEIASPDAATSPSREQHPEGDRHG